LESSLNFKLDLLVRAASQKESETRKALERDVNQLVTEYRDLDVDFETNARNYPGFAEPKLLDLEGAQSLLNSDSVLLYYVVGEKESSLFVVQTDGIRAVALPGRANLERLTRRVLDLLRQPSPREPDAGVRSLPAGLNQLSRTILSPAAKELASARRVLICADDILQYVPFSALTVPGGGSPLGISKEILTIPSLSVLDELRTKLRDRAPAPAWLALFADPVFDSGDRRAQAEPNSAPPVLARLPYSGEEARMVQQIVPHQDAWIVTGLDVNRETLKKADLSRFRVIEFATHTIISDSNAEASGIALSMVTRGGVPRAGFVNATELASLKIRSELVVLSGCETALGPSIRGEGLVSLARPLFVAGTRAVLATLWRSDDQASSEFMRLYYGALFGAHQPPATALRTAQQAMWKNTRWRDPSFWAAYVLVGDSG
jgi:CHAT domain-containing protein